MKTFLNISLIALFTIQFFKSLFAFERPNVILIMTDDQGYGDLSCHGNPILKTPELDKLHHDSIRFTDFHSSPFCTPTRAALMTGRYPARTGAYRTSAGKTMLHTDEVTIADTFQKNGYKTGMVGKWHLGDNAPHRPQDRGFQDVVWHRCGGIGQASDHWGNDYFDDIYERNGVFESFKGYCTDVWFRESMRFIKENKSQPFFLYLALNAPHGPYFVDKKWSKPYQMKGVNNPNFYGMIANIDHNIGLLRAYMKELNLDKNTIFIFMTDNGTSAGAKFDGLESLPKVGYNAGMRGKKSSIYEGGHRVPFFIHWPKGNLQGGKNISHLTAHIDVYPTLVDLCQLKYKPKEKLDGISFSDQLFGLSNKAHRDHLIIQYHEGPHAKMPVAPWNFSMILTKNWRLKEGHTLYHLPSDPSQSIDVAAKHPEVIASMKKYYQPYWDSISSRFKPVHIDIGNPNELETTLCSQDWYMHGGNPPWNFGQIKKTPKVSLPWKINIVKDGTYRFTLRQMPKEANFKLSAIKAKISISGQTVEKVVPAQSTGVSFDIKLKKGQSDLATWLIYKDGSTGGAYFTDVKTL